MTPTGRWLDLSSVSKSAAVSFRAFMRVLVLDMSGTGRFDGFCCARESLTASATASVIRWLRTYGIERITQLRYRLVSVFDFTIQTGADTFLSEWELYVFLDDEVRRSNLFLHLRCLGPNPIRLIHCKVPRTLWCVPHRYLRQNGLDHIEIRWNDDHWWPRVGLSLLDQTGRWVSNKRISISCLSLLFEDIYPPPTSDFGFLAYHLWLRAKELHSVLLFLIYFPHPSYGSLRRVIDDKSWLPVAKFPWGSLNWYWFMILGVVSTALLLLDYRNSMLISPLFLIRRENLSNPDLLMLYLRVLRSNEW